jgi:putative SOS response-associated peptidase YedK
MCGRLACGLAPDTVRRLSAYRNSQTHQSTLPSFIDLMTSTRSFRTSWNIAPTSTWYIDNRYCSISMIWILFVVCSSLCLISAKHLNSTEDSATRVLCSMRWSLVPQYHKGNLADFKLILNNCRTETMREKPLFKVLLNKGQRCVVLAEG